MKTEQSLINKIQDWDQKTNNNLSGKAQLVLVFGHNELIKQQNNIDIIKKHYPNATIVGCSTSGNIYSNEIYSDDIVCTAVYFEKTTIKTTYREINAMSDSYNIGIELAQELRCNELKHVIIFSDGLNVNGSELTKGLNNIFKNEVSVTGGLAGDMDLFEETTLVYNEAGKSNLVIAIGLYGDNIKVGYGSMGGWDSFGVDREVTKSKANILYELDNLPALELYKKYLGPYASKLPASALLFPLNLRIKDSEISLVRTVLSVNEEDGSMVFAGDIPQGEYVRLMKANFNRLIDGAYNAAEMSKVSLTDSDAELAILISCVGRKLVLKHRVEEELEAIQEAIGTDIPITGFYSYGEISPVKPFAQTCELHNQTMTITLLKEV